LPCLVCGKGGFACAIFECRCQYHAICLQQYMKENQLKPNEVKCHGHGHMLNEAYVTLYVPGFTMFPDDEDEGESDTIRWSGSKSLEPVLKSLMNYSHGGTLHSSCGVPCCICYGEEGLLKTLHCGFKIHGVCLKRYWSSNAASLNRLMGIPCPAEKACGCQAQMTTRDLRGVLTVEDFQWANRHLRSLDEQNRQLMQDMAAEAEAEREKPMFECGICLTDHDVEGCCTLPCEHRFCFESLGYHFENVVRERRLSMLKCPVDGCGFSLRDCTNVHIFNGCLSEATFNKLLDFLMKDDPRICECRHRGCEEQIMVEKDDGRECLRCPLGHQFCADCDLGPHKGITCQERAKRAQKQAHDKQARQEQEEVWKSALAMGWKPCPRRCKFGGGFKASDECDHVTCQCGFEFCWDCGVDRKVAIAHDNRWHKASCRYYTSPKEINESPKRVEKCPECQKMPRGQVCGYPPDDGYPNSYVQAERSQSRNQTRKVKSIKAGQLCSGAYAAGQCSSGSCQHPPSGIPGSMKFFEDEPMQPSGGCKPSLLQSPTGMRNQSLLQCNAYRANATMSRPVANGTLSSKVTMGPELISTIQCGPESALDCLRAAWRFN